MRSSVTQNDERAIRDHIVSLFDAYLAGDLETLRSGRTKDWKGFQVGSTRLVRGRGDYMVELAAVLGRLEVERYEFLDFEVDVYGDLAIAYYLARDHLMGPESEGSPAAPGTVLIRSIDVYRRLHGSWIQVGSNICSVADPLAGSQSLDP